AVGDALIGRSAVTSIVARPSTMMMAALCMIILILIAAAVTIGDMPVAGVGIASIGICAASLFAFWISAGHDKRSPWRVEDGGEDRIRADEPGDEGARVKALWIGVAFH